MFTKFEKAAHTKPFWTNIEVSPRSLLLRAC